jgi:hypothetical protein
MMSENRNSFATTFNFYTMGNSFFFKPKSEKPTRRPVTSEEACSWKHYYNLEKDTLRNQRRAEIIAES